MVMTTPITEINPALPVATRLLRRSSPAPREDEFVYALARKLDGFAPLTEQDRAALVGLSGYAQPVERHTVFLEQEGVADYALIVFAGFAGRYKRRMSGRRHIIAYLVPAIFATVVRFTATRSATGSKL